MLNTYEYQRKLQMQQLFERRLFNRAGKHIPLLKALKKLDTQNVECRYCSQLLTFGTAIPHFVKPLSWGGKPTLKNLCFVCHSCDIDTPMRPYCND